MGTLAMMVEASSIEGNLKERYPLSTTRLRSLADCLGGLKPTVLHRLEQAHHLGPQVTPKGPSKPIARESEKGADKAGCDVEVGLLQ